MLCNYRCFYTLVGLTAFIDRVRTSRQMYVAGVWRDQLFCNRCTLQRAVFNRAFPAVRSPQYGACVAILMMRAFVDALFFPVARVPHVLCSSGAPLFQRRFIVCHILKKLCYVSVFAGSDKSRIPREGVFTLLSG